MNISRSLTLLATTSVLAVGVNYPISAQSVAESEYEIEIERVSLPDAPSVAPLTARFRLNGETLDYNSKGLFSYGAINGNASDANLLLNGTYAISVGLSEGIVDSVYERNQTGWYLQHRRIESRRDIDVTQRQAVDVIGFKLQFSATGSCMMPGTTSDQLCTYTPGIATVLGGYDPDMFLPTEFDETTKAGDVISQETYDSLLEDGFQRGESGSDKLVGLDLDIPNSGSLANIDRVSQNGVSRNEHLSMRSVFSLSRVSQNIYSNDRQASISRTTRGFVLLRKSEWTDQAAFLQAAAWILPKSNAKLSVGEGAPVLSIPNNLFYASNNQWVPKDSFAVYESGRGYVQHSQRAARNITETPVSHYNGFWMGFSPVRDISLESSNWLVMTGDRQTVSGPTFFQGGNIDQMSFPMSSITIIDDLQNQISQINLSSINNLFVQSGLELTTQNALAYSNTRETSNYSLVPHIAFSGNRTDGTSVLRYYTGAILGDENNAYVGGDYSLATQDGLTLTASAMAYSKPDRDYYSFAEFRAIKTKKTESGAKLSYGLGARSAFDRPEASLDRFDSISNDSVVDLLGRYEPSKSLAYDVRQRLSNDTIGSSTSTTFGINYQVSDRFSLNAQITPFSTENAYIRSRAGMSWRVREAKNAGTLQLQFFDTKYDYGKDSTGQDLVDSEQSILAVFHKKF